MNDRLEHSRFDAAGSASEAPPGRSASGSLRDADLVCFSHLRWDFVYQRPQHLLSRFAKRQRVFFVEEPVFEPGAAPALTAARRDEMLVVVRPRLPAGTPEEAATATLNALLRDYFRAEGIARYAFWYYTPMAFPAAAGFNPILSVYDCMDELSRFAGAHPHTARCEADLIRACDLVFTGGHSLYEAKRGLHPDVHPFPSSIDGAHFAAARTRRDEPADQAAIPGPRIGFFGVIDERMDLPLVAAVADARPDWHLVMIGPVVKIDPARLPARPNIHYLGMKDYKDLPRYLCGWDVAMLPFARNASTEFISPTKTPEYLAAGRPVVSTPITDVVRPYGDEGIVWIAEDAAAFVDAVRRALSDGPERRRRREKADRLLARMSWDDTWKRMDRLMESAVAALARPAAAAPSLRRAPRLRLPAAAPVPLLRRPAI